MTADAGFSATAEDRLTLLVERLLVSAETAAGLGDWARVSEIVQDVLAVAPDSLKAATILDRALKEGPRPDGQRALVTFLFSDIVRCTDLADRAEPETMRDLFRHYRQAATEAIEGLGGKILQFQGDGVAACFGHPTAHEDDAQRAVLAGLELVSRMVEGAAEIRRALDVDAPIRVGIHTGMVVVARLTADEGAADVVGAPSNMAARLQAEAEPYTVVISDVTKQMVEERFDFADLGTRALKGIARPVPIFQVLRPRPAVTRFSLTPMRSTAVIGRQNVRRRLIDAWSQARHAADLGEPPDSPILVLRGPPGIGKSRIAAALCAEVEAGGGATMQAGCFQYHTNSELWPVARMIERRLGLYSDQPQRQRLAVLRENLESVGFDPSVAVPLIGPLLGLGTGADGRVPEIDPPALRAETLKVLLRWIALVAQGRPYLFVVDDLQWADATTVDLLSVLVNDPVAGAMVLVTSRDPVPAPWATLAVDIELGPIGPEDAAMLVDEMAGGADLDDQQRRLIVERGSGIPLFIEELTRSAVCAGGAASLPMRLQELLTARLRSPGVDLRVAQMAATFGPVFDSVRLAEVAEGRIEAALAQLQAAGIIEALGDPQGIMFRFSHVLLRDAAYETQVLDVRRRTHKRIAHIVETTSASPGASALVAQHLDLAGEAGEALSAYIAAAQQAQARASHTEARGLLDRALELIGTRPAGEDRDVIELMARMLRGFSVSSVYGYAHPDVLHDFQAADAICQSLVDRPELMPAQIGIWGYFFARGDHKKGRAIVQRVAQMLEHPSAAWFTPEVRSCLGFQAFYIGELEESHRVLQESWSQYMTRPPDAIVSPLWPLPNDPVAVTAVALACITGLEGRFVESDAWAERAIERAEDIGFPRGPFTLAFVNLYLAWLRMTLGDPLGALRHGQRSVEIGIERRFEYFAMIGRPYLHILEADLTADAKMFEETEREMDMVGHGAFRPAYLASSARKLAQLGQTDRALGTVGEALLRVDESGEWLHQPDLLQLRAQLTAAIDVTRTKEVVDDLLAAINIASSQGSAVLALRAANALAKLPEAARPAEWRAVLAAAHARLPPASECAEMTEAVALLAS